MLQELKLAPKIMEDLIGRTLILRKQAAGLTVATQS